MKNQTTNSITSKPGTSTKLVLIAAIVSLLTAYDEASLTAELNANLNTVFFLALVMAASTVALLMPEVVKVIASQASITLCVPLVVLSVLRPYLGDAVEPMWSILCVSLILSLATQVVADLRIIAPQVRAVFS